MIERALGLRPALHLVVGVLPRAMTVPGNMFTGTARHFGPPFRLSRTHSLAIAARAERRALPGGGNAGPFEQDRKREGGRIMLITNVHN